ncbi:MAG: class I SAM-dependent methyltransferase [Planctomycetota bacterium]
MPLDYLATAAFGLEAVVARELKSLGYAASTPQPGKVAFAGGVEAIARSNLWLRAAERVVIVVASFEAEDFGQLFDGAAAADWARWVPPDGEFPVRGRSHRSQLSSVPACQRIVKKAVVESLRAAHRVEQLPETGPAFGVEVALLDNRATLTLDTTGDGLHKRGYRPVVGAAPLRETLAAGILQLSYWRAGRPLLDPFCGTGTIPIEAALLGRNLAPGINRTFAAESWQAVPAEAWRVAREEARDLVRPPLEERLLATDVDADALKLARRAAEAAGVAEDIHFQQRAFADTLSRREHGCLFANPPYGERIGDPREVERLYQSFPDVLRRLPTWSHYVLTAWPDFEPIVGQRAARRRKLYNGRIACTLYQYHGPRPGGASQAPAPPKETGEELLGSGSAGGETAAAPATPVPAFGGLRPEAARQAEEFANRLRKNARHLRRWPAKRGVTCYRLYDRDIPEVPLAVDRYQDQAGGLWLHLAEYERPHDRTPAQHADWLDELTTVATRVLETPRQQTFLKHRARQRGTGQYHKFGDAHAKIVVEEAGLRFRVNLSDYLDTGLFLDHRQTRSMVRDDVAKRRVAHGDPANEGAPSNGMADGNAAGKRVLNLFAYTGSFSVYAAAGGAASTTTVDLSPTYLAWAEDNLRLNGFTGPEHELIQADSRALVESLPVEPLFDLAVIDPPTFSNTKRGGRPAGDGGVADWDIQQHAAPLLNQVARRLTPGGVIYFSTNSRRFKLDESQLESLTPREISRQTVPEDFRNRRVHRCWRMAAVR